ncbi:MAG TPA: TetR/AcrR family transcriptional regulator [Thermoleophilia bacterium]|nr:TetR/AcrR family transcriptional regulator [Thermoleophilia bacterium]
MNDRSPSGLEKLWMREQLESKPRLGLSLERIVESGIALADGDGLAAVSMKRVAESLGFTTMSLYRHVASKDELLLLMHDSAWRPPDGLDIPHGGWRDDLAWWTREQYAIMERHPWLDEVRFIERAGTPSQIAWMDLGLRALGDVQLSEYHKVAVLLLLSGYVSSTARLALTSREGAQRGLFAPDEATAAFGELLRTIVDPGRYPALFRAVEGGAFAPVEGELYAPLDFGLQLMLDGIERLIGA